jgi:hypothetical protein
MVVVHSYAELKNELQFPRRVFLCIPAVPPVAFFRPNFQSDCGKAVLYLPGCFFQLDSEKE